MKDIDRMGGNGVKASVFWGVPRFLAEKYPNLVKDQDSFVNEIKTNMGLRRELKQAAMGQMCGCTRDCGVTLMDNPGTYTNGAHECTMGDDEKIQVWATRPDW